MLRKISGRFSPKLICLFLSIVIGFSIGIGFTKPQEVNAAAGIKAWTQNSGDVDSVIIGFCFWDVTEGSEIEVTFSVDRDSFSATGGKGVEVISYGRYSVKVRVHPSNYTNYYAAIEAQPN